MTPPLFAGGGVRSFGRVIMPVSVLVTDLVTDDVEPPLSAGYREIADLTIPTGATVTGSGALVTHIWRSGSSSYEDVTTLGAATVAGELDTYRESDGPHPSDDTKWRFMITGSASVRVRCWIAVVGGDC